MTFENSFIFQTHLRGKLWFFHLQHDSKTRERQLKKCRHKCMEKLGGMFFLLSTFLFMRMQHMHADLTQPRWAAQASRTCKRPGWENRMLQTAPELSLKLLSNQIQISIICQFWEDLVDLFLWLDARAEQTKFDYFTCHEIKMMLGQQAPNKFVSLYCLGPLHSSRCLAHAKVEPACHPHSGGPKFQGTCSTTS